jgi:hypothetical protein
MNLGMTMTKASLADGRHGGRCVADAIQRRQTHENSASNFTEQHFTAEE